MAKSTNPIVQEVIDNVRRDILANGDFIRSILKDVQLTEENISPNLIIKLMSQFMATSQPPVPQSNAPKIVAKEKSMARPIAVSSNSIAANIVADILVGNNVYLYGKAGTGKSYLAKAVASDVLRQPTYLINCSQWTSPINIIGGQTIKGYEEGALIKAWADGGILILDELPKLDPNTAGLLNDALSETAAQPKYKEDGSVDTDTIPYIINGRGERVYKGQNQEDENLKFRFGVIGTGNTDMKSVSNNYSGNQRQDYSLIDRFAGSFYLLAADTQLEKQLIYPYVYNIAIQIRRLLEADDSVESVSLRTMLNFNRTYEQQMLDKIKSKFADEIFDNNSNIVRPKTLEDSLQSFLGMLSEEKATAIQSDSLYMNAISDNLYGDKTNTVESFKNQFRAKYHVDPISGDPIES